MISDDPEDLWQEYLYAEGERDSALASYETMMARAVGPFYKDELLDMEWFPENNYWDVWSSILPLIIFDNPKVVVRSRHTSTSRRIIADALRYGMNKWVEDIDIQKVLTDICRDYLFNWGVAHVTLEDASTSGMKTEDMWTIGEDRVSRNERDEAWFPVRPNVFRISQTRFVMDPLALRDNECRFMAHRFVRPKSEILAEAADDPDSGWNVKAIESVDTSTHTWSHKDLPEREGKQHVARDEIIAIEMWVPEVKTGDAEDGYHGTIFTLGDTAGGDGSGSGVHLREPRPFYGPPRGPYVVFGQYQPADMVYPMSSLVACEGQIRELNKHAKAISRNAAERKKVILYDEADTDAAEKLVNARDSLFIGVPNADKDNIITNVEIGGIDAQQLSYYQLLRDRVNRALGLSESQRGVPDAGATATAVAVAEQSSNARLGYLKKMFSRGVVEVFRRASWYFYHDDDIVFGLGDQAAESLGMSAPVFHGGGHDPESGLRWEDHEIELEPMSMERASEGLQAARTAEAFQLMVSAAPIMAQTPWVDWKGLLNSFGDARNMPNFGELYREQIAAMMLGAQTGQQPQTPGIAGGTSSKLVGDLGSYGLLEHMVNDAQFAMQSGNAAGGSAGKQTADSMTIPGGGG